MNRLIARSKAVTADMEAVLAELESEIEPFRAPKDHARMKPPITPPIIKFNANRAIPPPKEPPPGTIQRHIRWRPNGSPQSIQSHT